MRCNDLTADCERADLSPLPLPPDIACLTETALQAIRVGQGLGLFRSFLKKIVRGDHPTGHHFSGGGGGVPLNHIYY